MDERFQKKDIVTLAAALMGLTFFLLMFPRLFPDSVMRTGVDRDAIRERGIAFAESLGYTLEGYDLSVRLEYNDQQLRYMNRVFGTRDTNRLSDSVAVFHWAFRWNRDSDDAIHLSSSGEEQAAEALGLVFGDIRMGMDLGGRPIRFEFREGEEEAAGAVEPTAPELDRNAAVSLTKRLLEVYGGDWTEGESEERPGQTGVTRRYVWQRSRRVAGEAVSLEVLVKQGRIQSFRRTSTIPKVHAREEQSDWTGIASVVPFLLIFFFVVVCFVQRLRADLMDLKAGVVPTLIVLTGWLLQFWTQSVAVGGESLLEFLIGFLVTAPFICGGIWVLYTVGESVIREEWTDKLKTVDAMHHRFLAPGVGLSLMRGLGLTAAGLGLISLLDWAGIHLLGGYFGLGDSYPILWAAPWPSVFALSHGFFSSMYIVITMSLMLCLLKRRLRRWMFVLPLIFVFWALIRFPVPFLEPLPLRLLAGGCVGLLFVWFFLRYDLLTVLVGGVGIPLAYYGVALLNAGGNVFSLHGWLLTGGVAAVLVVAILAYRKEPVGGEIAGYVPAYLSRIYERERIQRELEIARNVQLTFLPRQKPRVKGMEIASMCVPAKEVGGDYYDFIELSPSRLGVVIGDVSGKGISAAFYMTLTKGFLRSQAKCTLSPRDVLIHMNELFYENAERGMFISMIYSIIDLEARTLTFARAGHNPMILRRPQKGEAQELNPPGIALGLEPGDVFNRTIEERTIGVQKDDVFLFYTDGLNEAQNDRWEEFGEPNLLRLVDAHVGLNAEELLNQIRWEIQRFTAGAAQHDDMTAVVLRIL